MSGGIGGTAPVLVLVEPAGPLNVGSVARLCANFGLAQLRLVAPRCDHLGEESLRMAVRGRHLLEEALLVPDLESAISDCHRVVACSGRVDSEAVPVEGPEQALNWLLEGSALAGSGGCRTALVFGREDRGLSTDELLQAGRILQIATGADYPSLNLSHAVAVTLHELQRARSLRPDNDQAKAGEGPPAGNNWDGEDPAQRGELEATLADAQELLLEVGFLYPHTAHARMAKLRTLLQRGQISGPEVALLRGMVRQLRWASRRRTT